MIFGGARRLLAGLESLAFVEMALGGYWRGEPSVLQGGFPGLLAGLDRQFCI